MAVKVQVIEETFYEGQPTHMQCFSCCEAKAVKEVVATSDKYGGKISIPLCEKCLGGVTA